MRKLLTLAIGIFICFHMAADDKTSPPIKTDDNPNGKAKMNTVAEELSNDAN